jgi:hypothetical protein
MSARPSIAAMIAAAAFSLCAGPAARAQSMPNITAPKAAATKAAQATNAHIEAEQNPSQQPQQAAPQKALPPRQPSVQPQGPGATGTGAAAKIAGGAKPSATPAPAQGGAKGAQPIQGSTGPQSSSVSQRGGKDEIALMRETFTYQPDNRRDPFLSLMRTGDLRPMISDLTLKAIIYDPAGRSVAILRDLQTKEQYRVKVGQTLGRMRVNQIRPREVIFTIEEIGMTRQEALGMNDVTKARTP